MAKIGMKEKKKPTKIEEMTKEQICKAIIKKRECNAKAQRIVESLLEKDITETYFLQCLPEINQCHFEDVIEERCIIHLCGYPLCQMSLLERDIPKQKYRISIKTNKVYDITTRKSFCSNSCYKSAMHIKKQMLTSPLWFREYEEIPKLDLLPLDTVGSLGQEVHLALVERVIMQPEKQRFTSINHFTSACLNEISNDDTDKTSDRPSSPVPKLDCQDIKYNIASNIKNGENKIDEDKYVNVNNIIAENLKILHTSKEKDINVSLNEQNNQTIKRHEPDVKSQPHKAVSNPLNIVGEIIEKPQEILDPILINIPEKGDDKKDQTSLKKLPQRKQPSITTIAIEVEKCLAEWFTVDTLIFIFGEERVKEMVADKGECIKEYLKNYSQGIFYNSNTYDQYQVLCRKLNMLELEDRKYDVQSLQREKKPLPDYSILQEESKRMQLKVKAFLTANRVPATGEQDNSTVESTKEGTTQLPLVDKNAQNALRRRIVCQHLNKVLPDLLSSLNLSTLTIGSDVGLLINTFKLRANNIMFKPIQWTLIAIVFIKLLSLRDKRLHYLLEQPTAFQHMQLLLLSYKQDGGYLDHLISWLTDVDRLLDVNDTQLSIES